MKIISKQNRYYWYLLFIPIYLIMFFVTETFIDSTCDYWVSYVPFDDVVPFVDWFVIFYVLWYPLLIAVGLLLLIKDKAAYERYFLMIMIGFTSSTIFFWILPNGQNLRPESFASDNIFTKVISMLYASDTNTNVLPSMHVYGSLCAMIAVIDSDRVDNLWIVGGVSLLAILISASTVLIKQHSVLDIVGAVILCVPLYLTIYFRRIFSRRETMFEKSKNLAIAIDAPLEDFVEDQVEEALAVEVAEQLEATTEDESL